MSHGAYFLPEAVKFHFFCVFCVLLTMIFSECVYYVYFVCIFVCIDQICYYFPELCQNDSNCQECTYFLLIGLPSVSPVICVFNLDCCYFCVYFIPRISEFIDSKSVMLFLLIILYEYINFGFYKFQNLSCYFPKIRLFY